jgi:hypothetical protein
MLQEAVSHWGWIWFAVIALITAAVKTRTAFKQQSNMVVIRQPGHRWFGPSQPAQDSAAEDLHYAWHSMAAYGSPGSTKAAEIIKFKEDSAGLGDQLHLWTDFPEADLASGMKSVHLRAQVWENQSEHLLVVTFGGTDATNLNDGKSNTHWLHPFLKDEYTVLGDTFARALAQELAGKMQQSGQEYLGQVCLQATGHSLDPGLAEKFAYSLPRRRIPHTSRREGLCVRSVTCDHVFEHHGQHAEQNGRARHLRVGSETGWHHSQEITRDRHHLVALVVRYRRGVRPACWLTNLRSTNEPDGDDSGTIPRPANKRAMPGLTDS